MKEAFEIKIRIKSMNLKFGTDFQFTLYLKENLFELNCRFFFVKKIFRVLNFELSYLRIFLWNENIFWFLIRIEVLVYLFLLEGYICI